jgi:hypothetical protein
VYQFHAWFHLVSTHEFDDDDLDDVLPDIERLMKDFGRPTSRGQLIPLNGEYWVSMNGYANRPRQVPEVLDDLLTLLATRLPGSYGLLYERDDETTEPPGPNAFKVRVLARGQVKEAPDPFFSPCNPVIED